MTQAIYVIATKVTNGMELGFVADRLRRRGFCVRTVDVDINAPQFAAALLPHFQELLPQK